MTQSRSDTAKISRSRAVLIAEAHAGNRHDEDAVVGESSELVSRACGEDAFGCVVGKASC